MYISDDHNVTDYNLEDKSKKYAHMYLLSLITALISVIRHVRIFRLCEQHWQTEVKFTIKRGGKCENDYYYC
jgi:hypothetical protein